MSSPFALSSIDAILNDQAKEAKEDEELDKIAAQYAKLCGMDVGSPNATAFDNSSPVASEP